MRAAGLEVAVLEKAGQCRRGLAAALRSASSPHRSQAFRLARHGDAAELSGLSVARADGRLSRKLRRALRYPARLQHRRFRAIRRDGAQWRADTAQGPIAAPVVVVATGIADAPYRPSWPGLETYRGPVIHSSEYRNPAPYRGQARAGGRLRQFRRRDRARSRQCRRRCRAGGSRPGSDPAARSAGLSDPVMGDPVPAVAGAAGRLHQRADPAAGGRSIRETGIAPRGQGAAPDGRGGWPRAADRYRHAGQDQGRLDQDARRHRPA